jgi:hypothetical protein
MASSYRAGAPRHEVADRGRTLCGLVGAGVVDHDDVIDEFRCCLDDPADQPLLIVRGDDNRDAQVPVHPSAPSRFAM